MRHGELGVKGNNEGNRWCAKHKHFHGTLYACEYYTQETLDEIALLDTKNRYNWSNREFIQKQLDGGMPWEGVFIMQMFAGLR